MYKDVSNGIEIQVFPEYVEEQSSEAHSYYFYSYQVKIQNQRQDEVQLQSRYWLIKDGNGDEEAVQGEGVIGQQPVLKPGESYTYTSFCPLRTKTGNMRGSFYFSSKDESFEAKIPLFFLRTPETFTQAEV